MGSEPRGPSFAPPSFVPPSLAKSYALAGAPTDPAQERGEDLGRDAEYPPQGGPGPRRTRKSRAARWSAVGTAVAVLLVGLVVIFSTVVAVREDSRPVASRVISPVSAAPTRTDRMEFVTADADGVLIISRRIWSASGVRPPANGRYLHVEVQLVCRNGTFSYGPENFSAFDAAGELFEVSDGGRWGTPLGYGILLAGESVSGTIAFDLPRGEVTLLMSDDSSQSVTAVKIPD
jgi:hypothetical protein